MSSVFDYFEQHPIGDDPLHKELMKIPEYEKRVRAALQEQLQCCGAEADKNGKVTLVIADPEGWNRLADERAVLLKRLENLDKLVAELDEIFEEAEHAEFTVYTPTIRGLLLFENSERAGRSGMGGYDERGKRIPIPVNPVLKKLLERADGAWAEYKSQCGDIDKPAPEPANPLLAQLLQKAHATWPVF